MRRLALTAFLILAQTGLAAADRLTDAALALKARDYRIVHFDFDMHALDRTALRKLDRQAAFIRRNPDIVFAVVGHTDKVGNATYNDALGLRRAKNVVAYLVSKGVRRDQLRAMTSRGEEVPVVATLDRERLNRRVETKVWAPRESASRNVASSAGGQTTTGATITTGTSTPPAASPTPAPTPSPAPAPAPAPAPDPEPAPEPSLPGNKAAGIGRPDAGKGNGDEASGDPEGSIGHNKGGDEPQTNAGN